MMPLTFADIGSENTILRVGGSPQVRQHLENLGFVAGGQIKIISAIGGNLIVRVKESRVALDRELASKIMV